MAAEAAAGSEWHPQEGQEEEELQPEVPMGYLQAMREASVEEAYSDGFRGFSECRCRYQTRFPRREHRPF